jgi:hypothetical protein
VSPGSATFCPALCVATAAEGRRSPGRGRVHRFLNRFLTLLPALLSFLNTCIAQETKLNADEQIVFYPGVAQRVTGETNLWRAEIRGRVFEPEKRSLLLVALREALDLKGVAMNAAEEKIFNKRSRLFLVDHERGKRIFVRYGEEIYPAGKSSADGRFSNPMLIQEDQGRQSIQFAAWLWPASTRTFAGEMFLLEEQGLSVISDIDDTIKITEVRDRHATLRNTFLREFQPVSGMAELYQTLARSNGAAFHYISASPWQLYEPLAAFVRTNGFPAGTFALKEFRWKDKSFFSLFANPEKYKSGVIEPLMKQFPKRKFIFVGDSGERDPEIYATLAQKYPQQIARIFIRDVTGESAVSERYVNAFRGVSPSHWQIFREPGELKIAPE